MKRGNLPKMLLNFILKVNFLMKDQYARIYLFKIFK
jgi:hypothetical protein